MAATGPARTSPPKPYEINRASSPTTSSFASSPSSYAANSNPSVPIRPMSSATYGTSSYGPSTYGGSAYSGSAYGGSSYGGNSYGAMNRYGSSYGSSYGGYGGSSYGGYGSGYGSSYGGYGGSSYGGYGGSSYGGAYGGYRSLGGYGAGRYGNQGMDPQQAPYGSTTLARLGTFVDGFGRFSQLLDANCDALYGTLSSILRMFDCMGHLRREAFYILQSVAMVGILRKIINWIRFGRSSNMSALTPGKFSDDIAAAGMDAFGSTIAPKKVLGISAWPLRLIAVISILIGGPLLLARVVTLILKLMGYGAPSIPKLFDDNVNHPNSTTKMSEIDAQILREGTAVVAFDFRPEGPEELAMRSGDLIKIISSPFEGWYEAEISGRRGLVPMNHLKPANQSKDIKSDLKGNVGANSSTSRERYVQQRNEAKGRSEWDVSQYQKEFTS